jgi:hypothetical protein
LADYPDTGRRVISEGLTLCDHSWAHPDNLAAGPSDDINAQITQTQQAFAALGVTVHSFRRAGGDHRPGAGVHLVAGQFADSPNGVNQSWGRR